MVSVATLITVAATFWSGVAPGVAQANCPDGVRYNVKTAGQMELRGRQIIAESRLGGCVITFKAGRLATYDLPGRCELVIHEYGHAALGLAAGGPNADALGHAKSGIMDPWPVDDTPPPGICFGLNRVRH